MDMITRTTVNKWDQDVIVLGISRSTPCTTTRPITTVEIVAIVKQGVVVVGDSQFQVVSVILKFQLLL